MRAQQQHPCEGCRFYDIKDYGSGQYERHDWFCSKFQIWNPGGCDEKEDEDMYKTE